jgi:hypothetical protein
MATTPQGDDPATRHSVMEAMTRAVARQQLAAKSMPTARVKPRKLRAIYTRATLPSLASSAATRVAR